MVFQTKVDISCRKMLSTCSWCRLVASWHHWWHLAWNKNVGSCVSSKEPPTIDQYRHWSQVAEQKSKWVAGAVSCFALPTLACSL